MFGFKVPISGHKNALIIAGSSDTLSNILDVEDETDEFPDEASQMLTESCLSKHMSHLEEPNVRVASAG